MSEQNKLVAALAAARKHIPHGTVHKGGQNSHQNYKFAGHEQVVKVAREALYLNGLTLTQVRVEYKSEIAKAQLWEGTFLLEHESGGERTLVYQATTQPNDKSAFVASTALDRTALLRVLQLAGSADEDPEHDSHDARDEKVDLAAIDAEVADIIVKFGEVIRPEAYKAVLARANELSRRVKLQEDQHTAIKIAVEAAYTRAGGK